MNYAQNREQNHEKNHEQNQLGRFNKLANLRKSLITHIFSKKEIIPISNLELSHISKQILPNCDRVESPYFNEKPYLNLLKEEIRKNQNVGGDGYYPPKKNMHYFIQYYYGDNNKPKIITQKPKKFLKLEANDNILRGSKRLRKITNMQVDHFILCINPFVTKYIEPCHSSPPIYVKLLKLVNIKKLTINFVCTPTLTYTQELRKYIEKYARDTQVIIDHRCTTDEFISNFWKKEVVFKNKMIIEDKSRNKSTCAKVDNVNSNYHRNNKLETRLMTFFK